MRLRLQVDGAALRPDERREDVGKKLRVRVARLVGVVTTMSPLVLSGLVEMVGGFGGLSIILMEEFLESRSKELGEEGGE